MKYVVGFSGGIDSTYTAYNLISAGHQVLLVNLDNTNISEDKKKSLYFIAQAIGAEVEVIDVIKEFRQTIIQGFIDYYKQSKTPNPCVMCNPLIKFRILDDIRQKYGYDKIITGHYADIISINNNIYISKAQDTAKDQSYMLYRLSDPSNHELLRYIEFGIPSLSKEQIKQYLKDNFPQLSWSGESQDICFIPGDYRDFIHANCDTAFPEGNFVDKQGNVLGRHKGIINYTIGQRSGLGGHKLYIINIDPVSNDILVGEEDDIYTYNVRAQNFFLHTQLFDKYDELYGMVRYRGKPTKVAEISIDDHGKAEIIFQDKVRAVTPGQHLVLYTYRDGRDVIAGGGEII